MSDAQDRIRDLSMFAHPDRWPAYPYLPLKRRNKRGWPEIGILTNLHVEIIVYRGANLFDESPAIEQCEKLRYATYEEMYDVGGWRVD